MHHPMFHPDLGREVIVPNERVARVYRESGWKNAPDPEPAPVGVEPDPVRYEPVKSKSAPKAKPKPETPKES